MTGNHRRLALGSRHFRITDSEPLNRSGFAGGSNS